MFFEYENSLVTDLENRWESYRVFTAPVNWRFESGDRAEFNWVPTGERLTAPFEIVPGVAIAPGSYHWTRWRLEAGTASKRRFSTQVTWWFGGFYDGTLHQLIWTASWNPAPIVTVELTGEYNDGHLTAGDFRTTVAGTRARLNISPDLTLSSYLQYRHAEPVVRHQHAPPVDRQVGRRSVRHLQPQRPRSDGSLATRLEPAPREVPVPSSGAEWTPTPPSASGRARTRS